MPAGNVCAIGVFVDMYTILGKCKCELAFFSKHYSVRVQYFAFKFVFFLFTFYLLSIYFHLTCVAIVLLLNVYFTQDHEHAGEVS